MTTSYQTHTTPDQTARDFSQCARCGANNEPLRGKDLKTGSYFAPHWVLAAVCVDTLACALRVKARDLDTDRKAATRYPRCNGRMFTDLDGRSCVACGHVVYAKEVA